MPSIRNNNSRGQTAAGTIKSISPEGCNVAIDGKVPGVGQRVLVRPNNGLEIRGRVRWVVNGHLGIEFDEPLAVEDVDSLRKDFQTRQTVEIFPAWDKMPRR